MAAALLEVCVDPRLNHEIIRLQVRQKLERLGLRADRIYVLNEPGGNLGSSFRQTAQLLATIGEPIVLSAVLHHDDCLLERAGERKNLAASVQEMKVELDRLNVQCPVLSGNVRTVHNEVLWSDEPVYRYVPFSFGAES